MVPSEAADLVIRGRLWLEDRSREGDIAITNGLITEIGQGLEGVETIDVGQSWVLPGLVDIHVHFREPGLTHKEDFRSGSTAAALGGVTTVCDMPNTNPPTTSREQLVKKSQMGLRGSVIDFGLQGGVTETADLRKMAELAIALKVYVGKSTGGLLYPLEKFDAIADTGPGVPIVVHAEDQEVLDRSALPGGSKTLRDHDRSRPQEAETAAVEAALASNIDRLHIAHVSSPRTLALLEGTRATFEVTPSHLLLNHDDLGDAASAKMNPPIRDQIAQEELWDAFLSGKVPVLASDHAPHTQEEKNRPFSDCPSGIPGVQTMGPLMLAKMVEHNIDPRIVIPTLTSGPADALRLDAGRLRVGARANIAIFNPGSVVPLDQAWLHTKAGTPSPFIGSPIVPPSHVLVGGQIVVEDGVFREGTQGEFLTPSGTS